MFGRSSRRAIMRSRAAVLFWLVVSLVSPALAVEPGLVTVGDETKSITLDPSLDILRDPDGRLGFNDVTREPYAGRFARSTMSIVNQGFSTDAYWYRVHIHSTAKSNEAAWILEIAYPLLDWIDLYVTPDDGASAQTFFSGDQRPPASGQIDHRHFAFPVELPRGRDVTIYARVRSRDSHQGPFILWAERAFGRKTAVENLLFGGYYAAAITIMGLYGVIALGVRDATLVYYIFWVASLFLLHLVLNGFGRQYLWTAAPTWTNMSLATALSSAQLWGTIFSKAFLETRRSPHLNRILNVALACGAACLLIGFTAPTTLSLPLAVASSAYVGASVLLAGIVSSLKQVRTAWLFTLSVAPTMFAIWLKVLELFGIAPTTFLS